MLPWRVAVIGAGPAGFYATETLLRQTDLPVAVDLFDRLPAPYGLVRYGVAPDHAHIKAVTRLFQKTALRSGVRFWGNVRIGRDVSIVELLGCYHQVLVCTGAQKDRRLAIDGEGLRGSWSATEFVGWYNAHPDFAERAFDGSAQSVAIVGNGNVALDVARILVRNPAELAKTDIAAHAARWLQSSQLREVHLIGRRGPVQAAFSAPELGEMLALDGVDVVISPKDLVLDSASSTQMEGNPNPTARRNYALLCEHVKRPLKRAARKVVFHFWKSPVQITGSTRVAGIRLECGQAASDASGWVGVKGLGRYENLRVQQVFRSIGYLGEAVEGMPFDGKRGVIPNQNGLVLGEDGRVLPRLYVAGWIKRGPKGVIGTNKQDAQQTVERMLKEALQQTAQGSTFLPSKMRVIEDVLQHHQVRAVSYAQWKRLDALECQRGKILDKPREKFVHIQEMIAALDAPNEPLGKS